VFEYLNVVHYLTLLAIVIVILKDAISAYSIYLC
jgi:hypothetical protein